MRPNKRCSRRLRRRYVYVSILGSVIQSAATVLTHMMKTSSLILFAVLFLVLSLFTATKVAAHCDTLDGPVVEKAKLALQKGDVTPFSNG
jgi:hypothetical protein